MPGWAVIAAPNSPASAITLSTPGGSTSLIRAASRSVDSGVVGAGLSTMVLPASSAAGTLNAIRIIGKFHGTIAPITPSGRRCVSTRRFSLSSSTFTGRSSMVK